MSVAISEKLARWKDDYREVSGQDPVHFFCPILYRDERVPLCEAHIVNRAFPNSSTVTTLQRQDVDAFFGSRFESDFVDMGRYRPGNVFRLLFDRFLWKRFKPRITKGGKEVEFYRASGSVPDHHSIVHLSDGERTVRLGLKINPDEMLQVKADDWEIEVSRDLRVAAVVSLIKAAHLTMFELLGYRYALSVGGHFVGKQILGDFYLRYYQLKRSDTVRAAYPFFREFSAMVRPGSSPFGTFVGTIDDKRLFMCVEDREQPWAFMVFVRTGDSLHAVLMPVFEHPGLIKRYFDFLNSRVEELTVRTCQFKDNQFFMATDSAVVSWPKSGELYP